MANVCLIRWTSIMIITNWIIYIYAFSALQNCCMIFSVSKSLNAWKKKKRKFNMQITLKYFHILFITNVFNILLYKFQIYSYFSKKNNRRTHKY